MGCWPGALPSLQAHDGPRSPLPPAVSHLPLPGGHTAHQQGKARPVTNALLLGEPPGSSWTSCLNRLHEGSPPRGLRPPETPGGPRQRPLSEPRQALLATALARLPCPGEGAEEGRRPASQPPTAEQARAWGLGGDQPQGTGSCPEKGPSSGVRAVLVPTLLLLKEVAQTLGLGSAVCEMGVMVIRPPQGEGVALRERLACSQGERSSTA